MRYFHILTGLLTVFFIQTNGAFAQDASVLIRAQPTPETAATTVNPSAVVRALGSATPPQAVSSQVLQTIQPAQSTLTVPGVQVNPGILARSGARLSVNPAMLAPSTLTPSTLGLTAPVRPSPGSNLTVDPKTTLGPAIPESAVDAMVNTATPLPPVNASIFSANTTEGSRLPAESISELMQKLQETEVEYTRLRSELNTVDLPETTGASRASGEPTEASFANSSCAANGEGCNVSQEITAVGTASVEATEASFAKSSCVANVEGCNVGKVLPRKVTEIPPGEVTEIPPGEVTEIPPEDLTDGDEKKSWANEKERKWQHQDVGKKVEAKEREIQELKDKLALVRAQQTIFEHDRRHAPIPQPQ